MAIDTVTLLTSHLTKQLGDVRQFLLASSGRTQLVGGGLGTRPVIIAAHVPKLFVFK